MTVANEENVRGAATVQVAADPGSRLALRASNWDRAEWLTLALVVTFGAHFIPQHLASMLWWHLSALNLNTINNLGWQNFFYLVTLSYGLLLVLPTAVRSGLCFGDLTHARWSSFVCVVPVLLTALVYPRLPERPFSGQPVGLWLISPLAQDFVFIGFLYGRFEMLYPDEIHPQFRIKWALFVTAIFFAAWHLPNFAGFSPGYVFFQLAYTFLGLLLVGLSRQWTGSILYATLSHMAVNFIAWLC